MKERPILFSGPMVSAILEGRKKQTRRIVKPQPQDVGFGRNCEVHPYCTGTKWPLAYYERRGACWNSSAALKCPYPVGTRLWVKETFRGFDHVFTACSQVTGTQYRADMACRDSAGAAFLHDPNNLAPKWKPSIFMPRRLSRITLEITAVRVERLQDISEDDAVAEGIVDFGRQDGAPYPHFNLLDRSLTTEHFAVAVYAQLWQSINGPDSWNANPFVWAYDFRRVEA